MSDNPLCDWFTFPNSHRQCRLPAKGAVTFKQPVYHEPAYYCEKHLGRFVLNSSLFVNSAFENMNGDRIEKVDRNG